MTHVIDAFGNILSSGTVIGLQSVQVFTADGTWTKPNGCNRIIVEVVGGGGGGGGVDGQGASTAALGGGGGGGGYSAEVIDVSAVSSVAVTVGEGGSGGAAGVTDGTTGETSSFGAYCQATGGGGGKGVLGAASSFGESGAGGVGSSGDINATGNGGITGRVTATANVHVGPNGGSSLYGGGARIDIQNSANGNPGGAYGGGGSGAVVGASATNYAGGDGADGIVVVWEFGQANVGTGSPHNLLDAFINQDTTAQSVTRGSLIYGNSTPKWDELVLGSAGQTLRSNGTDAGWAGGAVLLNTATASNSATIDFVLPAGYFTYEIHIGNMAPATDGAFIMVRTSANGGSSYDAGASDYRYIFEAITEVPAYSTSADGTADHACPGFSVGNASGEAMSGVLEIFHPSAGNYTKLFLHALGHSTDGGLRVLRTIGNRASASAVDGVRIMFSSGNISTGHFRLYGLGSV